MKGANSASDPEAALAGLMSKVGYHVPSLGVESWNAPAGATGDFVGEVWKEVEKLDGNIKKQRGEGLRAAFA